MKINVIPLVPISISGSVLAQIRVTVRTAICEHDTYFHQRADATGLLGASTDQKMAAAFRQLSMGVTADACVDYLRTGENLNLKSLKRLTRAIVACFESTWLRYPNEDEVREIEKQYSKLGFPGCIGAVDCASWEWHNCPVALQGQYKGMNKKPNCRMEVVCDDKLRIWHVMFGMPGAKNDKSILNQSHLFNAIRNDGIYPDFCIFAKPHPEPRSAKERMYGAHQSSARKGVERVFAVLFSQFEILSRPSRLHDLEDMEYVIKACCILHNMIAAERGYAGTAKFRLEDDMELQSLPFSLQQILRPSSTYEQAEMWRTYLDPIEDLAEYLKFREALQTHIWNTAGEIGVE